MRSVFSPAAANGCADIRIVCLPGAYQAPEEFLAAGFHDSVKRRGLSVDLLLVDAELSHLGDHRFLLQLGEEVLSPARTAGCRSIWLAGISLGGFMALDYVAMNPGRVDGVCLLAPYLGNRLLTNEIASARALSAWVPGELAQADEERRVWQFIQTWRAGSPPLYLGFGSEDRFADAHRMMARAIPDAAIGVVPGGHDWQTWKILWDHFLDLGLL